MTQLRHSRAPIDPELSADRSASLEAYVKLCEQRAAQGFVVPWWISGGVSYLLRNR